MGVHSVGPRTGRLHGSELWQEVATVLQSCSLCLPQNEESDQDSKVPVRGNEITKD